jgi:polyhydroxybutyrate depolymerase
VSRLFVILAWLVTGMPAATAAELPDFTGPGSHRVTLQHGGRERLFIVHVPARLDPAVAAPLLVALHGGGGSASLQADDAFYGQITQSERRGFVAVFPNGVSRLRSGMLATWNAGRCCGAARDEQVDDVGFIRAVVTEVTRQLRIDPARIYATGMSNGAMMAYRLACEAPDLFRAIAAVAGTDNTTGCRPSRSVSVLHIHARDDDHVLFDGGAGPASVRRSLVTDYTSVPDTAARWAGLSACTAAPRRTLDVPGARCDLHAGCRDGAQVQLCVTDGGGHSWLGGRKPRGGRTAQPSQAVSANSLMWDFFDRL